MKKIFTFIILSSFLFSQNDCKFDMLYHDYDGYDYMELIEDYNYSPEELGIEKIKKSSYIGLFRDENKSYLKNAPLAIKPIDFYSHLMEKNTTKWRLKIPDMINAIALISNSKYFKEGEIKEFKLKSPYIMPHEEYKFNIKGISYKLYATGIQKKLKDTQMSLGDGLSKYKLILKMSKNGKTKKQILVKEDYFDDKMIAILFIGDIDRDGILDFIIDKSGKYSRGEIALFLSSCANKNKILKEVSVFYWISC